MPVKKIESSQVSTSEDVKEATKSATFTENDKRISALEEKLNALIEILNSNPVVTANCRKDSEGKRKIVL